MPKFKKNTSKAMGPYKMKYKHSAFPFKSSPMKGQYIPYTAPPTTETTSSETSDFTSKYDLTINPYGSNVGIGETLGAGGQEWREGKAAWEKGGGAAGAAITCLLYTSPSPRD